MESGRLGAPHSRWLKAPEQTSLRRAFTVWLKRVFLSGRLPGVEFSNLNDLQEVRSKLAERVAEWAEAWKPPVSSQSFDTPAVRT